MMTADDAYRAAEAALMELHAMATGRLEDGYFGDPGDVLADGWPDHIDAESRLSEAAECLAAMAPRGVPCEERVTAAKQRLAMLMAPHNGNGN